jgi:hypothetical protein
MNDPIPGTYRYCLAVANSEYAKAVSRDGQVIAPIVEQLIISQLYEALKVSVPENGKGPLNGPRFA